MCARMMGIVLLILITIGCDPPKRSNLNNSYVASTELKSPHPDEESTEPRDPGNALIQGADSGESELEDPFLETRSAAFALTDAFLGIIEFSDKLESLPAPDHGDVVPQQIAQFIQGTPHFITGSPLSLEFHYGILGSDKGYLGVETLLDLKKAEWSFRGNFALLSRGSSRLSGIATLSASPTLANPVILTLEGFKIGDLKRSYELSGTYHWRSDRTQGLVSGTGSWEIGSSLYRLEIQKPIRINANSSHFTENGFTLIRDSSKKRTVTIDGESMRITIGAESRTFELND